MKLIDLYQKYQSKFESAPLYSTEQIISHIVEKRIQNYGAVGLREWSASLRDQVAAAVDQVLEDVNLLEN